MPETITELRQREKEITDALQGLDKTRRYLKKAGREEVWKDAQPSIRYLKKELERAIQLRLALELRSGKFEKGAQDVT